MNANTDKRTLNLSALAAELSWRPCPHTQQAQPDSGYGAAAPTDDTAGLSDTAGESTTDLAKKLLRARFTRAGSLNSIRGD